MVSMSTSLRRNGKIDNDITQYIHEVERMKCRFECLKVIRMCYDLQDLKDIFYRVVVRLTRVCYIKKWRVSREFAC